MNKYRIVLNLILTLRKKNIEFKELSMTIHSNYFLIFSNMLEELKDQYMGLQAYISFDF